jgi:hypothetical protein
MSHITLVAVAEGKQFTVPLKVARMSSVLTFLMDYFKMNVIPIPPFLLTNLATLPMLFSLLQNNIFNIRGLERDLEDICTEQMIMLFLASDYFDFIIRKIELCEIFMMKLTKRIPCKETRFKAIANMRQSIFPPISLEELVASIGGFMKKLNS